MSLLSIAAFPVQAAIPAAEAAIGLARPLLGLSAVAAFLMIFRPLLVGLLRAALLVVSPRQSFAVRSARTRLQGVRTLNRMARDFDSTQPNLAAELRNLASRG
jgi:hypothetical protein